VLILANCSGHHPHWLRLDRLTYLFLCEKLFFFRNDELFRVNCKGNHSFQLDVGSFRRVHRVPVDNLCLLQAQPLGNLQGGVAGGVLFNGEKHRQRYIAVAKPLHLGLDQVLLSQFTGGFQAAVNVVLVIQLVNVDNLFWLMQGTAPDKVTGPLGISLHRQVIDAKVGADRGKVVSGPGDDSVLGDAPGGIPGDAIAAPLWIVAGVHKHPLGDGGKIAAHLHHLLQEEDSPFRDLPRPFCHPLSPDLHQFLKAVHANQGLLGGVHRRHAVVVPGDVAPLIRGDGALDVGAGEAGDEEVQHMGHRYLPCVGLHVAGVHLGPHLDVAEEIPQGHGIGQIQPHGGGWRRRRRHRR